MKALQITLTRGLASWSWVVEDINDSDDFIQGTAADYSKACADALLAFDGFEEGRDE